MDAKEQEVLQKHLAQFLIKDVFNTITEEDVLKIKAPNVWEWKARALKPEMIATLQSEAEHFAGGMLWQILKAELLWHAQQSGWIKSKTEADQVASKMLKYLTEVIDSKLKRMGGEKTG